MAIKKVKLPNNSVVDINDSRIPGVDTTPTSGSTNVITSGGVQTALTNGSVTKIGTATVGSTAKPVYINAGVPALLGTVGTSTMPVYLNNGAITQISSFREAYLSWGGKNFSASYGPIDAAMVSELGACRTMFTKAAAITIEYSTNGGTTWVDYGATDTQKMNLFSTGNTGFVIGHASVATASASNMLRVTLNSAYASIYTTFNKFVIFVTTNGSTGCYCTMRGRTRANYDASADVWTTFADAVPVSGWSGYNVINTGSITFGSNNDQIRQLQFIFGCTGHNNESYAGLNVSKIFGFGGVGWTTPSNMAKTGHLYAFDALQNATFPAGVTGVNANFSGVLDLAGASNAADTTKGINFTYSGSSGHIGMSTALGLYSPGSIILRPNGATSSGAGNGSLVLSSDGIVANEKITAESFIMPGGTSSQFLKADGSVDSTSYGTYSKPPGGIPASDLASGVIPDDKVYVGKVSVTANDSYISDMWTNSTITYGTYDAISAAATAGKKVFVEMTLALQSVPGSTFTCYLDLRELNGIYASFSGSLIGTAYNIILSWNTGDGVICSIKDNGYTFAQSGTGNAVTSLSWGQGINSDTVTVTMGQFATSQEISSTIVIGTLVEDEVEINTE